MQFNKIQIKTDKNQMKHLPGNFKINGDGNQACSGGGEKRFLKISFSNCTE